MALIITHQPSRTGPLICVQNGDPEAKLCEDTTVVQTAELILKPGCDGGVRILWCRHKLTSGATWVLFKGFGRKN